jgi:outer membrane lipoprotein-sorting protein
MTLAHHTTHGLCLLVLTAAVAGCAQQRLPTYPPMDAQASLHTLAERARLVHTVSGEGLITLRRPDGQSIRLDAAVAMRPPAETRLRAWKLGQAVMDLTLTPDGVWMLMPDDPQRAEQIRSTGVSAAQLARTWSLLAQGFFDEPSLQAELHSQTLVLKRQLPNEPTMTCEVERSTLTPRRYELLGKQGQKPFSLELHDYRQFGQVVWPMRLVADSDQGTIEIELRRVDINDPVPPGAFQPPRRAERLP